ncbi:hypothetical protein DDE19_04065 [Micromonospora ureilytica]|uniref:Uncharacterized protein n=1 Tax=Micromonospora ureilytica TaxID=709868 RepID=A0A3N9Y268_9ACTN|nr:hypothetical protein [Micromonospora ureilytica]RQX19471.1 hypothetical protein DDE19_04065 [Micromonospora ureilytica]
MNETVLSVIGLILVAVSLCFSAIQTREVARQSRINNRIGSANAILEINNVGQAWHDRVLEDPALRPYFFDGKPCTPDDPARLKVVTLAERLADLLECNLQMAPLLPAFTFAHTWYLWPAHMLRQSPVLVEVVEDHPGWWEALDDLQQQIRSGGPLTHPLLRASRARWHQSRSRVGGGLRPTRDDDAATGAPAGGAAAIPPQR